MSFRFHCWTTRSRYRVISRYIHRNRPFLSRAHPFFMLFFSILAPLAHLFVYISIQMGYKTCGRRSIFSALSRSLYCASVAWDAYLASFLYSHSSTFAVYSTQQENASRISFSPTFYHLYTVWNDVLSLQDDRSMPTLDLLLQPHPICAMGKYQSASTTFQADCNEKAFFTLSSLYSGVHTRIVNNSSLVAGLALNQRSTSGWNVDVQWRQHAHFFVHGTFLFCLINKVSFCAKVDAC